MVFNATVSPDGRAQEATTSGQVDLTAPCDTGLLGGLHPSRVPKLSTKTGLAQVNTSSRRHSIQNVHARLHFAA